MLVSWQTFTSLLSFGLHWKIWGEGTLYHALGLTSPASPSESDCRMSSSVCSWRSCIQDQQGVQAPISLPELSVSNDLQCLQRSPAFLRRMLGMCESLHRHTRVTLHSFLTSGLKHSAPSHSALHHCCSLYKKYNHLHGSALTSFNTGNFLTDRL